MKKIAFLIFVLSSLFACSSSRYLKNTSSFEKKISKTNEFKHNFNGFAVYNPETNKYLIEYNADRYFTPASNTKLFSFFTGLEILGDSIPGLRYKYVGKDSLIIWGTGDPTFLHHFIKTSKVVNFLKKNTNKTILLSKSNDETHFYGFGWAWDDYNEYYSAENSAFPIYGNVSLVSVDTLDNFKISPPYAQRFLVEDNNLKTEKYIFRREFRSNKIHSLFVKRQLIYKYAKRYLKIKYSIY